MEYTGEELLHELQKKQGCEVPEPAAPPHSSALATGQDLLWSTQPAEETGHPMPPDFLERANPFFQQILIYHTLSLDHRVYADGQQIHLLRITATKRLLPFLREGDLDLLKAIRDCLGEVAGICLKRVVEMPMMGLMAHLSGEDAFLGGRSSATSRQGGAVVSRLSL
ncbi:hypothetical protein JCM10213v2_008436 [Rhodosporidiobolus nylandii]